MIKMPSDYLLNSTCGHLPTNEIYQNYSLINTHSLLNMLNDYNVRLDAKTRILDFGCGTGRLTGLASSLCPSHFFGVDRNIEHIAFAEKHNGRFVEYYVNCDMPPLFFENDFFDVIFSFSVFTHFSYSTFVNWIDEIYRLLNFNGVFLISLRGRAYYEALTCEQLLDLESIGYYENRDENEFGNSFNSYISIKKIHEAFGNFEILEHKESPVNFSPRPKKYMQDIWVLRKSNA